MKDFKLLSTICIWPDETWCYFEAINCYTWKSDDYLSVEFDELQNSPEEIVEIWRDAL
jgi:hypothetical protein